MLSSGGTGPIAVRPGGDPVSSATATQLPLNSDPATRDALADQLTAMLANNQEIDFSCSPDPTLLGTVTAYDPTGHIRGFRVTDPGSGYDPNNPPKVMITGGGETVPAKAHAEVNPNGTIKDVVVDVPGTYTSEPMITLEGTHTKNAVILADIGAGTATVTYFPGKTLPPNFAQGLSLIFSRPATDYAATAIRDLWYSWAQYYLSQTFNTQSGKPGSIPAGSNVLTLDSSVVSTLDVGMTVSGPGIVPAPGTTVTILGFNPKDNTQIYLSQVSPAGGSGTTYAFDAPQMLPFADPTGIKTITVTSQGSGYTGIGTIAVTSQGSGYTSAPIVVFTGGGGSGASATANLTGDMVTSITINSPGSGYIEAPTISFSGGGGGSGAAALAYVGPEIDFSGAGGASALPVVDKNGHLTGIALVNAGSGYTSAPTISFSNAGGGSGAAATASISDGIKLIRVTGGGSGYTTAPSVMFTGGGGSGVIATAVVKDGHVTAIAITNGGSGYTSAPTISFSGSGGSGAAALATVGAFVTPFPLTFTADQQQTARRFAGSVYEAMAAEAAILTYPVKSPLLPPSMSLVYTTIGCDVADLPNRGGQGSLVGAQVTNLIKSVLRGVYDFTQIPDQSQWYPNPATWQGGQYFNVYNLDPYVWFVHRVLGLSGYGFSVDDDTFDVSATASPNTPKAQQVLPDNLQIVFSGLGKLKNPEEWFNSVNWGTVTDKGTITNSGGQTIVTLTTPKKYWQIHNPDLSKGEIGAYVSGPGVPPGTTVVGLGLIAKLQLILSNHVDNSNGEVDLTFSGKLPKNPIRDSGFEKPALPEKPPANQRFGPSGSPWTFSDQQHSGIAGNGSSLTALNGPAPEGTQVAFLQDTAAISQTVELQAGTYILTFDAAQRQNGPAVDQQTINVIVNGTQVGQITPSGTNYTTYSVTFTVAAGKHKIQFAGTALNMTAFLDAVSLTVKLK